MKIKITGKWRNIKYNHKMFFLALLLIASACFVITLYFYQTYTGTMRDKLYEDYQNELHDSEQAMLHLYDSIQQLYTHLLRENEVEEYITAAEFDGARQYNTHLAVKKIYNINPYVDSLVIYNEAAGDHIAWGTFQFDYLSGLERLKEKKTYHWYTSSLWNEAGTGYLEEEVFTFAYPVFGDGYEVTAGIFINMDMQYLRDQLFSSGGGFHVLMDQAGILLHDGNKDEAEALVQGLQGEEPDRGIFMNDLSDSSGGGQIQERRYQADGEEYAVFLALGRYDLCYISAVPYRDIVGGMRDQAVLILVVALAVIVLSAAMLYLVTRRLYLPLGKLMEKVKSSRFAEPDQMQEFELIEQVYQGAMDEIASLQKRDVNYRRQMQNELLKDIFLGRINARDGLKKLKDLDWDYSFEGAFLMNLVLEETAETPLIPAVRLNQIAQILLEELGELYQLEIVPVAGTELVAMINTAARINTTFEELIQNIEQVRDRIVTEISCCLTIGMEGVMQQPEDLEAVYRKTREIMPNRFVFGDNQVLYRRRILEKLPDSMAFSDKLIEGIVHDMMAGSREEFEEKLDSFFVSIMQYQYQAAMILYTKLFVAVTHALIKVSSQNQGIWEAYTLSSPRSLEEGKARIRKGFGHYQEFRRAAEELKKNKHYDKIEASKTFIRENYRDYNLSPDLLAETFGYSTNYFSRIFKSITGYYINDYIRQVRIMKAEYYLTETDMTIQDIAAESGFANANYFFSVFKKETGLTPAAYRNINMNE